MNALALGIVLAVAASVALNGSYLLQHAGSASAGAITPRRPVATLRSLFRSPAWAAGAVLGMTGWGLHVGALSKAPLSLVQAFVAGGLALTVPMAALGLGHRATARERRAAALMAAALVLLSVGLRDDGRHAHASSLALAAAVGAAACAAAVLAAGVRGRHRAAALGLAGGLLYGAADLSIKALTGSSDVLRSPWLAVGLVTSCGAFFCFQRALQLGRPVTVIALMTAGTNATSIAGAFVVFGDPLGRTPALAIVHAAGFALVALAAWWLAPAQAALAGAGTEPEPGGRGPASPHRVAA